VARDASLDLLSNCLPVTEFRFDAMLCSILGNDILMRAAGSPGLHCRSRAVQCL